MAWNCVVTQNMTLPVFVSLDLKYREKYGFLRIARDSPGLFDVNAQQRRAPSCRRGEPAPGMSLARHTRHFCTGKFHFYRNWFRFVAETTRIPDHASKPYDPRCPVSGEGERAACVLGEIAGIHATNG